MTLRRILLLGLLSIAPFLAREAVAQGPQPQSAQQVAAQSSAAQAAIPQSEGESAAWRGRQAHRETLFRCGTSNIKHQKDNRCDGHG